MKKSLLALAIAAFASSAVSAATVYDKDGTSLEVGGRVQSVYYSTQNGGAGNNDGSITNTARLNMSGRSEIAPGIAAFGFAEWNVADGDSNEAMSNDETMSARDQYIGVDFGKFGSVLVGRTFDSLQKVIEVTDIYEDMGGNGILDDSDRRAGQIKYTWEGYGVLASVSYQSAKDHVAVEDAINDEMNVESGYAVALGYTTPTIGFGPISVKVGYSYLAAQDDAKYALSLGLDNMKEYAASVTWGNLSEGLYLATVYDQRKFDYIEKSFIANHSVKGIEALVGYAFDNGLSLRASWQYKRVNAELGFNTNYQFEYIVRKVPVLVNYAFNQNFNIWAEASFDAGSDKQLSAKGFVNAANIERDEDHSHVAIGARYTF